MPGSRRSAPEGEIRRAQFLGVSSTASGFLTALGLRTKPDTLRIRADPRWGLPPGLSDLTVRVAELAALPVKAKRAMVIANEITFLSAPAPRDGVAFWGKGFEVDRVGALPWLADADFIYWGELDTHGFANLNQLRAWLPSTRSLLMDRETLLAHRDRWVGEASPAISRWTGSPPKNRRSTKTWLLTASGNASGSSRSASTGTGQPGDLPANSRSPERSLLPRHRAFLSENSPVSVHWPTGAILPRTQSLPRGRSPPLFRSIIGVPLGAPESVRQTVRGRSCSLVWAMRRDGHGRVLLGLVGQEWRSALARTRRTAPRGETGSGRLAAERGRSAEERLATIKVPKFELWTNGMSTRPARSRRSLPGSRPTIPRPRTGGRCHLRTDLLRTRVRPTPGRQHHQLEGQEREGTPAAGSSGTSEIRILFAFDPWRSAILLLAGDKAGKWNRWYAEAIPHAERLYEIYLKERAEEEARR